MIIADLLATLSISDQKQWISDNLTKLYDGNYKQRLEIAHVLSWLSPNVTAVCILSSNRLLFLLKIFCLVQNVGYT